MVPQSYAEAAKWYAWHWLNLAAEQSAGSVRQRAAKARDEAAKMLAPAELSNASERAKRLATLQTHAD